MVKGIQSESLHQQFIEKNREILIDNIMRQIDDNDNSLRLTLNNKINLISNEILRKINYSLKDSPAEYDFKDISEVFGENEEELRNYVFELLDKRKKEITEKSIVDDDFNKEGFVEAVDGFMPNNKQEFETGINKIIYSDFEDSLFGVIRFTDEEQKQGVITYLKRYDFKFTYAVEDSIDGRNNSLKNLVLETHEKVLALNTQTGEIANLLVKNKAA